MAKVLHVAHAFVPTIGGTSTRLLEMFRESRHHHTVVCMRNFGEIQFVEPDVPDQEMVLPNVRAIRVDYPASTGFWPLKGVLVRNVFVKRILKCVDPSDFDIVVGHSPLIVGQIGSMLARRLNKPFVYEYHQIDNSFVQPPGFRNLRVFPRWWREKKCLDFARSVVVQTERQKQRIFRVFQIDEKRISTIAMGVNVERFRQTGSRSYEQHTSFGLCGNLSEPWGAGLVLRVFLQLVEKHQVILKVCGRGPLAAQFVDTAAKNQGIQWLGELAAEQMPEYYAGIDCLIVPCPGIQLWEENCPTKVLEALAAGRPVVASNVEGVSHAVGDYANYFEPGNERSLRDCLVHVSENRVSVLERSLELGPKLGSVFAWQPLRECMDELLEKDSSQC